jgi:outer membrane protein assembly factor BamB
MQTAKDRIKRTLRLRTGAIIVILTILLRFVLPSLLPGAAAIGVLGGLLGGLAFVIWWAFFSRAPKQERWIGSVMIILVLIAFSPLIHDSIATGMQGMMYPSFAFPTVILAFFLWILFSGRLSGGLNWGLMLAAIILGSSVWALLRSDGISGHSVAHVSWRWTQTSEELLLSSGGMETKLSAFPEMDLRSEAEWPGFRGPDRDSHVGGTSISTDWETSPPEELWRRSIGPGCASFALHGNLLFTQEQRGEDEIVSCYMLDTGEPVWMHSDKARFWDSHAGAGPRSTPTISDGKVYTCGATGILNVLNESDGSLVWSRNAADDTQVELPGWGFTSSPLVMDDMVVVAMAGTLVAYDIQTGKHVWTAKNGGSGYSSPHYCNIGGRNQILLMCKTGIISVLPEDGSLLWEYDWPVGDRILQPVFLDGGNLLLSSGMSKGLRHLKITPIAEGWNIEELWSSSWLKSTFNDLVVHKDHAYGFSGPFLECVDMRQGERSWKGGRYGGQLVLLSDQDLLLVLTEKGEIALIEANPETFTELGKIPVIEGKTWNHPVLVGDFLLVRNSQEMVAFRL